MNGVVEILDVAIKTGGAVCVYVTGRNLDKPDGTAKLELGLDLIKRKESRNEKTV